MPDEDILESVEAVEATPEELPLVAPSLAAAILLMILDEEVAADIVKQFGPEEMREVVSAMYHASKATHVEIDAALRQFVDKCKGVGSLTIGADPHIRSVMQHAVGNIRADNILAQIAPQSSQKCLEILRWMDASQITRIIEEEHPQVAAIILSLLTTEVAAEVLEGVPTEIQSDIVTRAARLEMVSASAIKSLEEMLSNRASATAVDTKFKLGGSSDMAKIISTMKRPESEKLLKLLKKSDKVLGQKVEDEMFLFDDLIELDLRSLGLITREVNSEILTIALRTASEELVDKMLASLSARAAQTIRDDMQEMKRLKKSDIEVAQKEVIAVARRLTEEGEIVMGASGDDYV